MKKTSLAAVLAATLALTACGSTGNASTTTSSDATATAASAKKVQVVATTFPQYDWVNQLIKGAEDDFEVSLLLDNGTDLHSFNPTAADILKVGSSDVFIYVGGESDGWVEDAMKEKTNADQIEINLVEALGDAAKTEEIVEGMQASEHHHDHDHEESEAHSKEVSTFEDSQVQDRALSDWAGEWQSGYPLAVDGTLDHAWEHKAESGSMTAEEYKAYYIKGYESEYATIKIDGDHITFTDVQGAVTESDYKYTGYYIQNWSTGTKAAMYRFEAVDHNSGAPVYIEFNDHIIEPCQAEHFHIRYSNESYDAIEDPENRWPTFFPASLSPEEVCEAVAGHGHSHDEDEEEHEHAEGETHAEGEAHEHEHEDEIDEHVWLSLKNAQIFVDDIAEALITASPENADLIKANAENYVAQLKNLDAQYQATVDSAKVKTVLFGDRFPFRYLVDDYNLEYYAAFVGCSAETEASFETVVFLAGKVDECGLGTILVIENSDQKIAETIRSNTTGKNQEIAVLDSLQSTNQDDIAAGKNYLDTMTSNLEVLKKALTQSE
ncbi:MAG: ZinT/AdcA family metal-binding protein [Lachnospiraceae bacterium]|nr:ZinT/AdcA family metal-binding protein [Lachnospiraceae bacterium]